MPPFLPDSAYSKFQEKHEDFSRVGVCDSEFLPGSEDVLDG